MTENTRLRLEYEQIAKLLKKHHISFSPVNKPKSEKRTKEDTHKARKGKRSQEREKSEGKKKLNFNSTGSISG